ncbi:MAG: hypothetical protein COA69_01680 [Robiginitomaculum sp.]|nr:MAG: hypothetical protein COA69_01680 [Robiginitomaculum sp.]
MRHIVKFAYFCFVGLGLAILLKNTAFAADQNTYRSGATYLKTAAHHYAQCEQQCKGDAACRSWNFLRPNAGSATGICEFNANAATPVSSPVSMSGNIKTSIAALMSHAVSARAHTIRIGMPVPQQYTPQRANTTHTQTYQQQASQQQTSQEKAYYRQQYLAQKQRQAELQYQRLLNQRQIQMLQPPQHRPQLQTSRFVAPTPREQTPNVQNAIPANAPQHPQSANPASLYGSLHDDLTQNMSIVPRPQTAPDDIQDPNAPIATSRAVPTIPVRTTPMTQTAIPALAGG